MADCREEDGHDHLFNLLLIGDPGVGKSSLVSRFTRGKFRTNPKPTSSNNVVARHVYLDGKVIKVQVLDFTENCSYSDSSTTLLNTNGVLIVYDVTTLSTFENAEKRYRELQTANAKFEVVLIGNKSDLMSDLDDSSTEAGKAFADRESLLFIETSAKDNRNVEKAFVEVVARIFQKLIKNDTMDTVNAVASPTFFSEARLSSYSGRNEPAHYMLKIEYFSLLSEAKTKKFESDVFEASGYKWRLEMYPNGNQESWGNHISIYLEICDAYSLPKGWEVWVDGKFCVYDHIRHNYITFQDVHGKRTRFHEKMVKWGFSKLISLNSFTDPGNGFLFHDSCVFGAEVFAVPKYAAIDQCLSIIKPPAVTNTHTWTIEKFSEITDDVLNSDYFKIGKAKWKLHLYPKGKGARKGKYLSIYLGVHNSESLPEEWRAYAKYKFRVIDQGGDANREMGAESYFCKTTSWGNSRFMLLSEVGDPQKGFLLDDVLIVEVEISIVGLLKNHN